MDNELAGAELYWCTCATPHLGNDPSKCLTCQGKVRPALPKDAGNYLRGIASKIHEIQEKAGSIVFTDFYNIADSYPTADAYEAVCNALNKCHERAKDLETKIAELETWKRAAENIMPPLQEIGRELGLQVGEDISTKILPEIIELKRKLAAERMKCNLDSSQFIERVAQITAHRVCCGTEHDPSNGKLHGCCVVCGVPWPCEYARIEETE